MTSPTLTYDPDVQALYIQVTEAEVAETLELSSNVYVDVDRNGDLVGIEVLHADSSLLTEVPTLPDTAALRDLLKNTAA